MTVDPLFVSLCTVQMSGPKFRNMQPIVRGTWLVTLGLAALLQSASVRAQAVDPRFMTRSEVQVLQEALTWASSYSALKDGNWGRIAAEAASDWRRQNGLATSDSFSAGELRLLLSQGARERAAMRWTTFRDSNTGVWIGYPGTLVQPQPPRPSGGGVTVTDLRGGDGTLEVALFGPGLDRRGLREMLTALAQEPQVEQVVYRLDRESRQVQSSNLRSGLVRYVRFDREGNAWRGFAVKIAMSRQDGGRLITAISGEFSAGGRPVIDDPTNLPRLGPILANAPVATRSTPSPAPPDVEVPPPRP